MEPDQSQLQPPQPLLTISKQRGFGVASIILASVALIGPVVFWLAFIPTSDDASYRIGSTALGVMFALVLETYLSSITGILAIVFGTIAIVKNQGGRILGIVALSIIFLILVLLIIQFAIF